MQGRRVLRLFARVALVHEAHWHGLARDFVHLPTQLTDCARSCSLAGVMTTLNNWPSVSTAICALLPLRFLAPS